MPQRASPAAVSAATIPQTITCPRTYSPRTPSICPSSPTISPRWRAGRRRIAASPTRAPSLRR